MLPAGPAGTVHLDFAPGAAYRAALIGGAAAVLLVAVLAAVPVRPGRDRSPAGRERDGSRVGPALLVLVAVGGMAFVAGPVGVAPVVLLWATTALLGRHRTAALAAVAFATSATAGILLLASPDGTGTARQVLAVVALGAVVAGIVPVPAGADGWVERVRRWLRWAAAEPGRS